MKQVLSYGAGVQTFGMLKLVEAGEIERPDLVIFADTQGEKDSTYQHIEQEAKPLLEKIGLPLITVSRGSLLKSCFDIGHTPRPPLCSKTYKTRVIEQYIKKEVLSPGEKAQTWIGISLDEEHRSFSQSEVSYVEKRFPLLELELSRYEVKQFTTEHGGIVPPKSGCWYCPWNSNRTYWMALKRQEPEKFALALRLEKESGHKISNGGFWLAEIEGQTTFDFEELAAEDGCTQSVCMI